MSPHNAAPNHDPCGRCRTRHGGNNHLCEVHGPVSEGCCEPACNPAEWKGHSMETGFVSGRAPVPRSADSPLMSLQALYDATAAVLRARGVEFRPADLYGFVSGAYPTDDTPADLADSWQDAIATQSSPF